MELFKDIKFISVIVHKNIVKFELFQIWKSISKNSFNIETY